MLDVQGWFYYPSKEKPLRSRRVARVATDKVVPLGGLTLGDRGVRVDKVLSVSGLRRGEESDGRC